MSIGAVLTFGTIIGTSMNNRHTSPSFTLLFAVKLGCRSTASPIAGEFCISNVVCN